MALVGAGRQAGSEGAILYQPPLAVLLQQVRCGLILGSATELRGQATRCARPPASLPGGLPAAHLTDPLHNGHSP